MTGPRRSLLTTPISPWPLLCVIVAFVGGFLGGRFLADVTRLSQVPIAVTELPYPHVVPQFYKGVSLRFAMVHDVIHERFPRHGTAYYQERNRLARLALEQIPKVQDGERPPSAYFNLLDDLAVGLEMTGEHDEAIRLMRDKLERQRKLNVPRPELYSTYANLGTFLILGPFRQIKPGDEGDKKTLREGLECIKTAIEINPDSHFGREVWQVAIIDYMIMLHGDPELLLRFDMIGNRMDRDLDGTDSHPMTDFGNKPSGVGRQRWGDKYGGVTYARRAAEYLKDPSTLPDFYSVRRAITWVGAEAGWGKDAKPVPFDTESRPAPPQPHDRNAYPVPFDEPVLGIIGMWRLGGGAHPYFAVSLGETMLRVGQRYLAWSAFERASRLADRSWPDRRLQDRFRDHCRRRQAAIAATLPSADADRLKEAFESELAIGEGYQKAYQRFEEDQTRAGKSIDDAHFYDAFDSVRPSIATPPGKADWFTIEDGWLPSWGATLGIFVGGGCALAVSRLNLFKRTKL